MLAACPHRPACPGCPRFGSSGLDPRTHERVDAFAARIGLPPIVVIEGTNLAFRHRARLAARGRIATPKLGLFELGTHQVVDIPNCPIHAPPINRVAAALKNAIKVTRTPLYSEKAHAGLLRYVQAVVERSSGRVQVVAVCNDSEPTAAMPLLDALGAALGDDLHSLFWNGQPAASNQIVGPHWHRLTGPDALHESLGGADVFFPPAAFGQSNLNLFERIVESLHTQVLPNVPVVELYAGVGAIGLGLAARGERVVFNEVGLGSLQGLGLGIDALGDAARARVRVEPGAAEDVVARLPLAESQLIVDPPRKGLHPRVIEAVHDARPQRVIYLSCGLDSFLRDADALLGAGFTCSRLEPYALFPFTEHVEILAVFDNPETR